MADYENLRTRGYALGFYELVKEGNTVVKGLDEVIDDAIQSTLVTEQDKRIVKVYISENKTDYIVSDNGCGMSSVHLRECYEKCRNSEWKKIAIGLRGYGRFIFAGICGNFENGKCLLLIKTSEGNEISSEVLLRLTKNEELLTTPLFRDNANEGNDDDFNVSNGKLKGTIVEMRNGLPIANTIEELVFSYGCKYRGIIYNFGVELYINDIKVEPIDVTHDFFINNEGITVTNTDKDKYCTIHRNIVFYHKDDLEKKSNPFSIEVKCTTSMSPNLTKEEYEWEKVPFNHYGGVFVDLNGRLINLGNNANTMFRQNILTGNTKGKGKFGDTQGHLSAYNRLTIILKTLFDAQLFKVKAIKSNGIENLTDNELINHEYFVDENTSLFNAICSLRYFCDHAVYDTYLKKHHIEENGSWDNVESKLEERYNDFDFNTSTFKTINKGKKGKKEENNVPQKHRISDKSSMFSFSYTLNKGSYEINKTEINEDNETIKRIKATIGRKSVTKANELIKLLKNSHIRILTICLEAQVQDNLIKTLLITASKVDSKKYSTLGIN